MNAQLDLFAPQNDPPRPGDAQRVTALSVHRARPSLPRSFGGLDNGRDVIAKPSTYHTVATPAARRTDPESSHQAAEIHTLSGKRAHQQDQAAAAVRQFPGRTSFELALCTDLDRYMLARRLPECETAGRVRRGPMRACTVTGRLAMEWLPA